MHDKPTIEEVFAAGIDIANPLQPPAEVQLRYARHVGKSLGCAGSHRHGQVLIEAETGVGKTIGYLVPAMLEAVSRGGRIVVSTYTKSLQRQVIQDAGRVAEAVERVTGRRLRVARLVGKANFFDIDRVMEIADSIESAEDKESWDALISWLSSKDSSGEVSDYLEIAGALPAGMNLDAVCICGTSSGAAKAAYDAHLLAAKNADVLVVNHALLCVTSRIGSRFLKTDGDDRPIVAFIIDEADRMPDAARSIIALQFPINKFNTMVSSWLEDHPDSKMDRFGDATARLLKRAQEIGKSYSEAVLWDDILPEHRHALLECAGEVIAAEADLRRVVEKGDETGEEILEYMKTMGHILIAANAGASSKGDTVAAFSVSPTRKYPSLSLLHLYPARILKSLWAWAERGGGEDGEYEEPPLSALILTSATLSGGGRRDPFGDMRMEFGIYDQVNACSHLHESFSPQKFGAIDRIVYADPSVPKPIDGIDDETETTRVDEKWAEYAASMIRQAASGGGKVLALCGSYQIAGYIKTKLGDLHNVFCKARTDRLDDLVGKLLAGGSGVLLTPVGWEGLDARSYGFSWDHVVICNAPIKPTESAHKAAIRKKLLSSGKSPGEADSIVYGQVMQNAFRRMRQGIGRGIRSATDRFTLWIADPRIPPAGSVTESDTPIPKAVNAPLSILTRVIPKRFVTVQTSVFLKDGTMISDEEDEAALDKV